MVNERRENEMEQREITMKQFIENCPKCGKEIRGGSQSAVAHNLKVHLMACPSNKENAKQ